MYQQQPERLNRSDPPGPPGPSRRFIEYLIGLGLGAIPMGLMLLAVGGLASQFSGTFFAVAILLYLFSVGASIVCLVFSSSRFIGYGLLTMAFVTPVVFYIACVASVRSARPI